MDPFTQAASQIVKEQQSIIGPIALEMAKKVSGLQIVGFNDVKITGDGKMVLEELVKQYAKLFGNTSVEVCKEAFAPYSDKIPPTEIPDVLKN